MLGGTIKALNSTENIANTFTRYHFNGMNMFDVIEIYEELKLIEIDDVLNFFNEDAITTTTILPK
jgi:predicted Zn-dependent peptidase